MSLHEVIINFFTLSIPEEFAMCSMILLLLKRFDYFEKGYCKDNIIKIFCYFVIPIGIISDTMLFILKVSASTNMLINMILIVISILVLNLDKIKSSKNSKILIIKTVLFSILGIILFSMTEVITAIMVKYGFHTELENIINKTVYMNFIITIPERIVQYGIIIFFVIKHNSLYPKLKLFDVVLQNKILSITSLILLIIDIFIIDLTWKYLFVMNILKNISISYQLFIIITILSLVLLNMLTILLIAICIYPKEKYLQKFRKEEY